MDPYFDIKKMASSKYFSSSRTYKNQLFFSAYNCQQNWSFSDSLIYYITKNPLSAKVYQKLMKSSKHFFIKNPIIVTKCLKSNCIPIESRTPKNQWLASINKAEKMIDLEQILYKFWIADELEIHLRSFDYESFISPTIPHIYRCDVKYLDLVHQIVSYKDFLFISSNVESIAFYDTVIKKHDETIISFEELLKLLPKVKMVQYNNSHFSCITTNTAQKLLELPNFPKIDEFYLSSIREEFDIETFFAYIKTNKHTKFWLSFGTLSEAYKNRLEGIVDEILGTNAFEYKPPYIKFYGMNEEKEKKLELLSKKYL